MSDIKTLVEENLLVFKDGISRQPDYLIIHQYDWPALMVAVLNTPYFVTTAEKKDYYHGALIVKTYDNHFRNNPKFVTE